MKKLTIKELISFRGKQDRAKRNFAAAIKLNKPEAKRENGGDYWIAAVSAIARACKEKDAQIIMQKITELGDKLEASKIPQTKARLQHNIDLLAKYQNIDFKKWIPPGRLKLLKCHKAVLTIKELFVESLPHFVFSFGKENNEVGAVWLIAKKQGFKKEELGMFTDILARYLRNQHGKEYIPNPQYCVAVDLVNAYDVNYKQLQNAEIPYLLNKTIDELKKLM